MSHEERYNLAMSIMTYEGLWGEPTNCYLSPEKKVTLLGKSQLHCYSEIAEQKVPQRKKKQAEEAEEE